MKIGRLLKTTYDFVFMWVLGFVTYSVKGKESTLSSKFVWLYWVKALGYWNYILLFYNWHSILRL
jgi:hypothetical protein